MLSTVEQAGLWALQDALELPLDLNLLGILFLLDAISGMAIVFVRRELVVDPGRPGVVGAAVFGIRVVEMVEEV